MTPQQQALIQKAARNIQSAIIQNEKNYSARKSLGVT